MEEDTKSGFGITVPCAMHLDSAFFENVVKNNYYTCPAIKIDRSASSSVQKKDPLAELHAHDETNESDQTPASASTNDINALFLNPLQPLQNIASAQ